MKSNIGAADGFYREDAARLVEAAARGPAKLEPPPANGDGQAVPSRSFVPPVLLERSTRPLLAPEPATNQNDDVDLDERDEVSERARPGFGRTLARIIILPLYVAIAVASAGIVVLFVMSSLGR